MTELENLEGRLEKVTKEISRMNTSLSKQDDGSKAAKHHKVAIADQEKIKSELEEQIEAIKHPVPPPPPVALPAAEPVTPGPVAEPTPEPASPEPETTEPEGNEGTGEPETETPEGDGAENEPTTEPESDA